MIRNTKGFLCFQQKNIISVVNFLLNDFVNASTKKIWSLRKANFTFMNLKNLPTS